MQHAKGRSETWTFELLRTLVLATKGQFQKISKIIWTAIVYLSL